MASKPRLLFVLSGSLDVGGAERQLMLLAPRLHAGGLDVQVLCLWKRGAMADQLEAEGVRVSAIPAAIGGMRGPFAKLARLLSGWLAVRRAMRRWSPDIVHFVLPHAYLVGGFATLLAREPKRIMSRRGLNRYLQGRPIARWLEAFLHARMDVLLGNSQAVCRELIAEGAPPQRVGLIYNGVDLQRCTQESDREGLRRVLGVPADALLLVKVANLWAYKGHADLVAALARVTFDRDWRLLLVGRDEGAESALRQQVSALGIEDKVLFAGPRDDVPALLAVADIGISASHEEGFSNAVLEYLAAGLVTVVTDVGGNAEAVAESGLVVPPGDCEALAAALERLLDPALRVHLGQLARERAEQFSIERCLQQYEQLYQGLLAGQALPPALRAMPSEQG